MLAGAKPEVSVSTEELQRLDDAIEKARNTRGSSKASTTTHRASTSPAPRAFARGARQTSGAYSEVGFRNASRPVSKSPAPDAARSYSRAHLPPISPQHRPVSDLGHYPEMHRPNNVKEHAGDTDASTMAAASPSPNANGSTVQKCAEDVVSDLQRWLDGWSERLKSLEQSTRSYLPVREPFSLQQSHGRTQHGCADNAPSQHCREEPSVGSPSEHHSPDTMLSIRERSSQQNASQDETAELTDENESVDVKLTRVQTLMRETNCQIESFLTKLREDSTGGFAAANNLLKVCSNKIFG